MGTKGAQDAQPGPGIGPAPGACSGVGKNGNLQTSGATRSSGRRSSATSRTTTGMRHENYSGTLAGRVLGRSRALGANGLRLRAAHRGSEARARQQPGERRLPAPERVPRDHLHRRRGRLLDGALDAARHATPRRSARCSRSAARGSASRCDDRRREPERDEPGRPEGQCHSNEDSAYLTKIADYVNFFKGLKSDPNNVIVAAHHRARRRRSHVELRAPPGGGTAIPARRALVHVHRARTAPRSPTPPIRIKQLLDQFPNRSTFSTICQQDLSGGLELIAQLLKTVIGRPCIEGKLADVDPNTAGPQYDCSVSDVTNYGKANQTRDRAPAVQQRRTPASSTNKPCWAIETDATNCTRGSAPHAQDRAQRRRRRPRRTSSYCVTCT